MTREQIDQQIEAIKAVAEKYSASRESALEFLKGIGIYPNGDVVVNPWKDNAPGKQSSNNALPGKPANQ